MLNKRFIMAMLLLALFAISAVSAADNATEEIADMEGDLSTMDVSPTDQLGDVRGDVNLTAKEQIGYYGNGNTELTIQVKDKDANNVTGGSMTFVDVFGRNYTAEVINGIASADVYTGGTGRYNITCIYSGCDLYNGASGILPLYIPVTDTTCTNIVATRYDDTVYFSGNVVADYTPYKEYGDFDDREEVTEGNVTVFVGNERLGVCDVDINGNFVYIWKTAQNLIGQTINFTGVFTNNQKHYNPSNFSKTFTFDAPKATEISYERKIIDDYVVIEGTVNDDGGIAVIGGTITVNGIYSIPVDANGRFTFRLTDNPGGKANYTIGVIDFGSKADITVNKALMDSIRHTELVDELIDLCKQGSPYIKFGNGNGKTIVVNVGTHGGELASQAAGFKLIDLLATYGDEINGTIYVFPVIFPEATANNVRIFNMTNLNTVADKNGSISNNLVKFAQSVNASGLGDFHCTRHSDSDVGITCVMCTLKPTYESYLIAEFVANETGYDLDKYQEAGVPYAGAIEDCCNIIGIPAITSESLTNHKAIEYGAPEKSFNMMRAFLKYFGYDLDSMIDIPLTGANVSVKFESPYNYNSSNKSVEVIEKASITLKSASFVINYDGKYSATLMDSKGKAISGKSLTFTLNGKKIGSATTNAKGVATVKITAKALKTAKAGKWNMAVVFAGKNYKSSSKTAKITIIKEKVKIVGKAKAFKKSVKTKKYTVILKDSKNKVMKGIMVTLKVKGKTYSAKTLSNGQAVFKLTNLNKVGSFNAGITFKGNACYNKIYRAVKITVKK